MNTNELFEQWLVDRGYSFFPEEEWVGFQAGYAAAMREMSEMKAEVFIGFDHGYRDFGDSAEVLIGCTDIKALIPRPQIKG